MDETVVNGAQSYYAKVFGMGDSNSQRDSWLLGLLNSAPYLCCAFIGCWLTEPMNAKFGRRGTVFIACVISALACLWQGFTSEYTVLPIYVPYDIDILSPRYLVAYVHRSIRSRPGHRS